MSDDRPTSEPQTARPDRWRRPLIGPFTVAQVLAVVASIVVAAATLAFVTTPLAGPRPTSTPPRPGASFVPVGDPVPGLTVGALAPEFTGTNNGQEIQLTDLDGNEIRLADMRGKVVWINFWATWCPPCQEETPILRDLYDEYADDGLEIVAISVQETTADDVRSYVERYDLNYTVGFDATSAIFHTYRAFGLPTQLFVDRDGVIQELILGPITRASAEARVARLLGLEPPSPGVSD
jgi:thiol-disulfide isomerase/thioredoxin